jgi:ketosteroid isomerase-like protein
LTERPNDADAVGGVLRSLESATNSGDLSSWSRTWDEEARLHAPQTPPLVGRADIVLGSRKWFSEWRHHMRVRCAEIHVCRPWAFACGTISIRSAHKTKKTTSYIDGKFLAVARYQGAGRWALYRFSYNSSVPAP